MSQEARPIDQIETAPQSRGVDHVASATQTRFVDHEASAIHESTVHLGLRPWDQGALQYSLDTVSALEDLRIRTGNRLAALKKIYGAIELPEAEELFKNIAALERAAIRDAERLMEKHPLAPWIEAQKPGIAHKGVSRLLGAIGDPYVRTQFDEEGNPSFRPRLVSELWHLCGMHVVNVAPVPEEEFIGVAPRKRAGQQLDWNPEARKRLFIIVSAIEKQSGGKWRGVYNRAKKKYEGSVHHTECSGTWMQVSPSVGMRLVRCKTEAGEIAQKGDPLKPGHIRSRALRYTGKEFLKGLWLESQRLHGEALGQAPCATQNLDAP